MRTSIVLASGSEVRSQLLRATNVPFDVVLPRVDEAALKDSLLADGAPPRDIADALAEMKAVRVGAKHGEALVIGADQVLEFEGGLLSKPLTPENALDQLTAMSGKQHRLLSAVVVAEGPRTVWRHVGVTRMTMRQLSADYLQSYVARNWDSIRHAVGAYKLEEEGVRLFSQIAGSYFDVLGLPLPELLGYLATRGAIET